jgi:hypothetical protein
MIELNLEAQHSQAYDVYFTVSGGPRFVMWNTNHGITVGETGMSFAVDGQTRTCAFADIAGVHLSSGSVGRDIIDQCKIEHTSGDTITISNAASRGFSNKEQTQIYRDFVYDLHGRLAGAGAGQGIGKISFTAGMSGPRYKGLFVTLVIAGLFFVATPLALAIVTHDMEALMLVGAGALFVWPFVRVLSNNTPRNYKPDALPDELVS